MKMRRTSLVVGLAAALTLSTLPAAQAQNTDQLSSAVESKLSSGSSEADKDKFISSDSLQSSETGNETWDQMHPMLKVLVGILGATAIVTAFGMLRTIFYNLFRI
ncbi:hypothetical protein [Corynebacterium auriscanis]|uniref:Secreted protein n=1 Tax=Corynebacterium auriscanis TaxID=99807 RepID=A0A0A2DJI2_9CORY|nr:hypothetical protein [Corynebacterium auriscanis]KGM19343.1 hypothetical protein MA47_00150 [Corynebacterium auriscanis]WJY72667.1 hypothetical protein CAURIC_05150 [Corynebacterium auriscanis]